MGVGRLTEAFSVVRRWGARVLTAGLTEAAGGQITDPDDIHYRNLTDSGDPGLQENPARRTRMRRTARLLYAKNAAARGVVDNLVARVWGAGLTWKADDPAVDEVVKQFCEDPDNAILDNGERIAKEALALGELFIPAFINPINADLKTGYLAPEQVESVIWRDADAKKPLAILQTRSNLSDHRWLWIVPHRDPALGNRFPPHPALQDTTGLDDADSAEPGGRTVAPTLTGRDGLPVPIPFDPVTGQILPEIARVLAERDVRVAGICFYHRHGGLMTGRGRSIFETITDWLKGLDDFLFGVVRNCILQGYLLFQVRLTGAQQPQVDTRQKQLNKLPAPGSIQVTNEKEEWIPHAPNSAAATMIREVLSAILRLIGLAIGLPASDMGADNDVNRSTAKEAKSVATNRGKMFQRWLAGVFGTWIAYQVDQKDWKGQLPTSRTVTEMTEDGPKTVAKAVSRSVQVTLPELDARDEGEMSTAAKTAVDAMAVAVEDELVTQKDARAWVYSIMGMPVPSEADWKREIEAQRKDAEERGAGDGELLQQILKDGKANLAGAGDRPPKKPAETGRPLAGVK